MDVIVVAVAFVVLVVVGVMCVVHVVMGLNGAVHVVAFNMEAVDGQLRYLHHSKAHLCASPLCVVAAHWCKLSWPNM